MSVSLILLKCKQCKSTLIKALKGNKEAFQHIDDLAWGRKGRLKTVLDIVSLILVPYQLTNRTNIWPI